MDCEIHLVVFIHFRTHSWIKNKPFLIYNMKNSAPFHIYKIPVSHKIVPSPIASLCHQSAGVVCYIGINMDAFSEMCFCAIYTSQKAAAK